MALHIVDFVRRRAQERYKDWRERIAVGAAVDIKDVEKMLEARDPAVVRALFELMGRGGQRRLVKTALYNNLRSLFFICLNEPARHYAMCGPTGIGKTFCVQHLLSEFEESQQEEERGYIPRVAYLYVSEYGNRKSTIMQDVAEAFRFPSLDGSTAGRRQYKRLVSHFRERHGNLLVIDEAQRLDYGAIEALRGLMDQTPLSMLFIGSNEFRDRLTKSKLDGEVYGQFIRRIEWSTPVNHATTNDVREFLGVYGIEATKPEAAQLANVIKDWGDLSTLYAALCLLGKTSKGDEMSWRGLGAGRVLEAVESIIDMQRFKPVREKTEAKEAA
jgi:hypothetical protein